MICELSTSYGTMFLPDTDNCQYAWLLSIGTSPENEYIEQVCAMLDERPRGIAVDVGANFGCWTLALAPHAIKVWAFEPQRGVVDLLKKSVRAGGHENIRVVQAAMGAAKGSGRIPDLDINKGTNFGGISLAVPHPEQPDAPMIDVNIVTIDDYSGSFEHPISFIKIDVEGSEAAVIEGARRTINEYRPIMFVEVVHKYTNTESLVKVLEDLDYGLIGCDLNYLCMPI
jgi:FkbM family methyltransferase